MSGKRNAAYRNLSVKLRRDSGLPEYLDALCGEIGVTVSSYTRQALIGKLRRDGYLEAEDDSAKSLERAIGTYRGQDSPKHAVVQEKKRRQTTVMERVEAVARCIELDERYAEAANACGVSYQQIYLWMRRYRESGLDGLVFTRGKRREGGAMTREQRSKAELRLAQAQRTREETKLRLQRKLERLEGRTN